MSFRDDPLSNTDQSGSRKRPRIEQACARCKAKKTKCDGDKPACSRCQSLDADCFYGEVGKRGKGKTLKEHVRSLEERLARMEALLAGNSSVSHATSSGDAVDNSPVENHADATADIEPGHEASIAGNEDLMSPGASTTYSSAEPISHVTKTSDSLLASLPPCLPGAHLTKVDVESFRGNLVQKLPRMQTFSPLPPTFETFSIVETYLDEINPFLPIFHAQYLRLLCQRGVKNSAKPDPLWWACTNVILAITTQSRSTDDGFSKLTEFSWAFFKNAFSVYDEIITSEPSILGLQVLLVMVTFVGRTSDLNLTLLLSSTCVHMARALGLDKQIETPDMPHEEAQQRKRLIWITFVVDTVTRTKADQPLILSGEDIQVDMPEDLPADHLGCYEIPGTNQMVNIVNLMIQITIIRSSVYNILKTSTRETLHSSTTQNYIASIQSRINAWIEVFSIDYRPEASTMALDFPVLVLHLAYYDCVALVGTLIHKSAGLQESIGGDSAKFSFTRPESIESMDQRAHLSRYVLDLSRSCNAIPFVYLWHPLQDMLAATIELTSSVLNYPDSQHALANVKAIGLFVRFLKNLKYDKGCDVTRLLNGCIIMETAVKGVVLGEPNANVKAIKSLLTCSPGNRLLAQALMTTIPKLNAVCEAAAVNVFTQSEHRVLGPLLAPECLMPSSYNFGPDPAIINVVDIMRAVYSDLVA